MPTTTMQTITEEREISEPGDILITAIEADDVNGGYVREIRIFGANDEGQSNNALVFTLRLRASIKSALQVGLPPTEL